MTYWCDRHRASQISQSLKIGLLGGSFNPAHEGHVHISLMGLKRLKLDEVWWLVSPQNPLKKADELASYDERLQSARSIAASHPHIRVLDLEQQQHLAYTIDTIRYLQKRFPHAHYVWLMGADNLAQFHRWRKWKTIAKRIPFAVFDRLPYANAALRKPAAAALSRFRLPASQASVLAQKNPPSWVFLPIPTHPASATDLRKKLGKKAFMRHNKGE